jgi:hypothetical protein
MLTCEAMKRRRDQTLKRLERQRDACLAAAKANPVNAAVLRGLAADLRREIELRS